MLIVSHVFLMGFYYFFEFSQGVCSSASEGRGKLFSAPIDDKKHVIWRIHFNGWVTTQEVKTEWKYFRKHLEKLTKIGDSMMMNDYLLHWTKSNELTCRPRGSWPLPAARDFLSDHIIVRTASKSVSGSYWERRRRWDAKTIINKWEAECHSSLGYYT